MRGSRAKFAVAAATLAVMSGVQTVLGTSLTWNKNTTGSPVDGAGTWNTSSVNWYNGSTDGSWVSTDTALFGVGGAGGTVTLGTAITASGLTFNTVTSAYTIAGTQILTLGGTSAPIITDNYTGTTTFTAPLAGTQGITFAFNVAGTLALNDTNTYTGGTVINGGSVNFTSDASFGAVPGSAGTNITLTGGAGINYSLASGTTSLNANRGIAVGNGSGGSLSAFSGRTLTYGGIISDVPGQIGNFSTTSVGTIILTGNSTYSGSTTMLAGTFKIGINNALPVTTSFNFSNTTFSPAVLDLDGHNQSITNLSDATTSILAHNITNSVNGTSTLTVTGTGTFGNGTGANAGVLKNGSSTAVLALTKSTSGTLTLVSANTYTGATNITGGTLALSGAGSISSSSTVNVGSGAIFDISAATTPSLGSAQTLIGTGSINGTLIHSAGAINPGTVGTAGTLSFNNGLTLNGGALNFDLSGTSNTSGGGVNDLISVTGALNLNATTPVSVSFSGTPTVGTTYTVLTSGSETGSGTLLAQQHGYTISNSTPGLITITYVGGPAIANQVWSSTSSMAWDVNTSANWFNTDSSVTDNFFNGDNVTFNDSISGVQTSVTLAATLLPGSVTINSNSSNYTFTSTSGTVGKISGTTGLTKLGSSTLTMSTTLNDYSGVTNISGGILNVAGLANINTASSIGSGSAAGSAADLVLNGGTLQYTGSTAQTTNRLLSVGIAGGILDSSGTASITFNGTGAIGSNGQTGTRTVTLAGSFGSTTAGYNTFAPVIGDNGGSTSVSKTGSGAWILSGSNTNTGSTSITGGILQITSDGNLGAAPASATPGSILLNGGQLLENGAGTVVINANRGIALGNSGGTLIVFSGKTMSYAGVIADAPSSSGALSKDSVGTLLLSGSSTYSGSTTILAGTIQLGSNNALPQTTTLNFTTPSFAGALDLHGFNQTVGGLSDSGAVLADTITNSGTLTSTLTVNGSGAFNGAIKDGTGKVALTHSGSGTLELDNVSTYTGPTNITGGTLSLNFGSIQSSSVINVGSGATFDINNALSPSLGSSQTLIGNGNINGTLNHSAGVINPGTVGTAGTLTFNNDLNLNGGGISLDLSGASTATGSGINDLINVSGSLNVNNPTPIMVSFSGTPTVGSVYQVINAASESGSSSNLVAAQHGFTVSNPTPGIVDIIYTGGPTSGANLTWNSTSSSAWDVNTSPNWFNTNTSLNDVFFSGDNVTFDNTPGVQTSISLTASLAPASVTINSTTNNFSFSGSGKITGATGLTKMGSSTLTMATALNDYSGVTTIAGGILNVSGLANINVASSIGAGSVAGAATDLVINGGTLQYTGSTAQTTNRLFSIGTSGATIDNSGTGAVSFTGTGALGFNGQTGARALTLTGSNSTTSTIVPIIGDNGGSTSIVKSGSGTWALSGTNTFTGTVTVTGGTLTMNTSDLSLGAVPASPTPGTIVLNGGGLADNVGGTTALNSNRGIALGNAGGTISAFFNKTLTYGGIIANLPGNTGSFIKDSLGMLVLSNSSTYSGSTTINSGTIQLGVSNALPPTTSLIFNDLVFSNPGSTLDLAGFSQTVVGLSDTSTLPDVITSTASGIGVLTVAGGGNFLGTISDGGTGKITSITKSNSGSLMLSGTSTYTGDTNINGGTLVLAPTGSIATSGNVNVNSTGTLNLAANAGLGILPRVFSALNVNTGGTVTVAPASNHVNRQFVELSGGSFSGLMDLANNDMDLQSGGSVGLATVTAAIKQGFNAGGAIWQGSTGITSSSAASDSTYLTALGVILNGTTYGTAVGSLGLFDGTNPGANDVLVKYTYYGDTNLDGVVDGSDYTNIDNGFNNHLTGWQNGDFNYDGVVDGSDYTLIDNSFNMQGSNLSSNSAALIATSTSQLAGTALVPEPTSLGLLGIGAVGLIGRRRRSRRLQAKPLPG